MIAQVNMNDTSWEYERITKNTFRQDRQSLVINSVNFRGKRTDAWSLS